MSELTDSWPRYLDGVRDDARRGEKRADNLDVAAGILGVLGVISSLAILAGVIASARDDNLDTYDRQETVVLGGAGLLSTLLVTMVVYTVLSGLAALVRNSSRSLMIQAIEAEDG